MAWSLRTHLACTIFSASRRERASTRLRKENRFDSVIASCCTKAMPSKDAWTKNTTPLPVRRTKANNAENPHGPVVSSLSDASWCRLPACTMNPAEPLSGCSSRKLPTGSVSIPLVAGRHRCDVQCDVS